MKALLIDANSLIHRAWHALPPMTAVDGTLVNAVYGFSSVLMNILQTEQPDYLAVCWDTPEPTFRHVAEPEYKAQRERQPDEFYNQIPLAKKVVSAFGGMNVELPGYEADDLLGTIATKLAEKSMEVTVLTSDRDALQLVAPHIHVMAFKKGVSETLIYDEKTLLELTGLRADQIAEYKALRGDTSDNLKGVPGIGEKTATELIQKFENLKGIFQAARNEKSDMTPSVRRKLIEGEQAAEDTLPLVQLQLNAPIPMSLDALKREAMNSDELRQLFLSYGFKSLITRLDRHQIPLLTTVPAGRQEEGQGEVKRVPRASVKSDKLTETDLSSVLSAAKESQELFIHVLEQAQESLFAERPELALASNGLMTRVTPSIVKAKSSHKQLADIFADTSIQKNGHGLKSIWHWCNRYDLDLSGISFDTEIAAYLLSAGEGHHDLETIAASRLEIILTEGEDALVQQLETVVTLCADLRQELTDEKLMHVFERFERTLIPVLAKMEERGILIDRGYFKSISSDFSAEKARLEHEMIELAGEQFNPSSPSQLAHILFDTLKISIKGIKRGKTGFSTAASELEKLEGTHPIIEKISEYREVSKLLSTYVDALPSLADADGRIHTTFNQALTSTGRLSSSNPNLQNIPIRTELGRKIRRGFIASPGYQLLSCDYSQIELRVIAALSHDKKMLEAFEHGLDIHTATAAAINGIELEDVTKDQRRAAKAINFGIIYGQGPHGLAKNAGISYEEAKHFIDEYFQVYSGIREYLDQTKALAHARGYVETLFGRRRPIPEINSPIQQVRAAAERMAINMPVQGTATGDLIKLALIQLAEKLPQISSSAQILLQVHDEVVFEVLDEEVEKVARSVKEIMEHVEKIGCPIVVEAKAGKSWEEMRKIV
ncbi:DNA polymerase I [Patescibacteria group bacterium]|nr:DNA polymerase I [Patescibacteria group bacterium]